MYELLWPLWTTLSKFFYLSNYFWFFRKTFFSSKSLRSSLMIVEIRHGVHVYINKRFLYFILKMKICLIVMVGSVNVTHVYNWSLVKKKKFQSWTVLKERFLENEDLVSEGVGDFTTRFSGFPTGTHTFKNQRVHFI